MKDVDKFLIILLVAFLVSRALIILSPWAAQYFYTESGDLNDILILQPLFRGLGEFILNLALATWVFKQAKKEETKALFWFLVTFVTGIFGPILFYAYFSYEHSKKASIGSS